MVELVLEEAKEKMEKSIDAFSNELVNIRTGRANPSMLDRVMVEYYGSPKQAQEYHHRIQREIAYPEKHLCRRNKNRQAYAGR